MLQESSQEITQEITNTYAFIGRRVLKSEWYERVNKFANAGCLKLIGRKYLLSKVSFYYNSTRNVVTLIG